MRIRVLLQIATLSLLCPVAASATPIHFEFGWSDDNGYSLNGVFSIDDDLLGTGVITQDSLLSFSMYGFFEDEFLGSFEGIPESWFFDTTGIFFPVGETEDVFYLQAWNFFATEGIQFLSARFTQSMGLDGERKLLWEHKSVVDGQHSDVLSFPLPFEIRVE